MHCVLTHRCAKFLAQSSSFSFCRIGGSHQIAPGFHGALFFENHHDTWRARHKFGQTAEEGPLTMDSIEAFRFTPRHMQELQSSYAEPCIEDTVNYCAHLPGAHCVRFNYAKRKIIHFAGVVVLRS